MIGRASWVFLAGLGVLSCGSSSSESNGSGGGSTGAGSGSTTQGTGASNVAVSLIDRNAVDRVDLLLVIDNSPGMADKQALLSLAVPQLIDRLIRPACARTDEEGAVVDRRPPGLDVNAPCPDGYEQEFPPVDDIHLGVITSSLGGHGGDLCSPSADDFSDSENDRAHLLPTVRPDLNLAAQSSGFLAWDPDRTTPDQVQTEFADHVNGAGETGCGYEAILEAWYRFLIDPTPPMDMVIEEERAVPMQDDNGIIVDATVLQQRAEFLRPDSVVAIIMFSDGNDCSVVDGGIGWWTTRGSTADGAFVMPAATSACDQSPNDSCCHSCAIEGPAGCAPASDDPNCDDGRVPESDPLSLRCYDQKQRFGVDLLYPIERYVAALKDSMIYDTHRCDDSGGCPLVQNPLFDKGDAPLPRDPSLVYLAGIVGVPWQDVATAASVNTDDFLEFMTVSELGAQQGWSLILGDTSADDPRPGDPLMIEQPAPRSGVHPITGDELAPETSTDPTDNPINGHELVNVDDSELQYACIFPLPEPRDCADAAGACDCTEGELARNSPLCNPPGGGEASTEQSFAKAYPAPRLLETLRDFGDNAIVTSVCPKYSRGDSDSAAFGYNPAIAAIADRLGEGLGPRCLPAELPVDPETNQIPCKVIEVTLSENSCDPASGRRAVDANLARAVHAQLEATEFCGGETRTPCDSYFLCEIQQLSGPDQAACLSQVNYPPTSSPGFCYVDAEQEVGNEALLRGCPVSEPRKLQFVGENTPVSGSLAYLVCGD